MGVNGGKQIAGNHVMSTACAYHGKQFAVNKLVANLTLTLTGQVFGDTETLHVF
jgi:hypothetical protein